MLLVAACMGFLSACASNEIRSSVDPCPAETNADCYPVWFATNRKPNDDRDLGKGFTDITDDSVHYGRVAVSVPRVQPNPSMSAPGALQLRAIAGRENATFPDSTDWERDAQSMLTSIDSDRRDVVVFIHGFGTPFDRAGEEAATLGVKLGVHGVMTMFSWPSQGKRDPLNYLSDLTAMENSEDQLAEFLAHLGSIAGPGRVHVIAHSLGVYGFLRSLQSATAQAKIIQPKMRFGQVIFAAPDVDARLFKRLAAGVPAISSKVTLYVSDEDYAVKASEFIHGDRRIGLLPPVPHVDAMDTVEVLGRQSRVDIGHSYFRDVDQVLTDIQTLINFGESPGDRRKRNGFPLPDEAPNSSAWVIRNRR